jgi:hypothetical protein
MRVLATAAVLLLLPSVVPATTLTWEPAHHLAPQGPLEFPVAGDLDGDGDIDISAPSRQYWNVGTAQAPVWELELGVFDGLWPCSRYSADLGDLDGDGDLDLILTCWDEYVFIQLNEGTPQQPAWSPFVDSVFTSHHCRADLADIDCDGDLDIIATTFTGAQLLHRNEGTPQSPAWSEDWEWLTDIDLHLGDAMIVRYGDLDLDGDMDAVGLTADTWPQCWENVGTPGEPQFEERPEMLTGVEYEHKGWTFGLELLDIDADGDLDLLIQQYYYGQNMLFLNQLYTSVEPASWGSIKALFR